MLYCICMCHIVIASSKQRSSLRRAITAEKKKVLKHIQQYNSVVYDVGLELPHLQESDIFDGKFPWSPLSSKDTINELHSCRIHSIIFIILGRVVCVCMIIRSL